jgi:hypothetical protein
MAVNIIGVKFFLFYSIAFPLILGLSIYLQYRLKSDLKKIKTIGDIEFTRTGIRKRIGDSLTEYEFHSIAKLELQKHIPAVTAGDGKSGYFSYILKIIFNNSSSESLVISDKPTDTKQDLSVVDTMKTLKKIIKSQISIES